MLIVNDWFTDIPNGWMNKKIVQVHVTSMAAFFNRRRYLDVQRFVNLRKIVFPIRHAIRICQFRIIHDAGLPHLEYIGVIQVESNALLWCETEFLPWRNCGLATAELKLYQCDTDNYIDLANTTPTAPIVDHMILQCMVHDHTVYDYEIATDASTISDETHTEEWQRYFSALARKTCKVFCHSVNFEDVINLTRLEDNFDRLRLGCVFSDAGFA